MRLTYAELYYKGIVREGEKASKKHDRRPVDKTPTTLLYSHTPAITWELTIDRNQQQQFGSS